LNGGKKKNSSNFIKTKINRLMMIAFRSDIDQRISIWFKIDKLKKCFEDLMNLRYGASLSKTNYNVDRCYSKLSIGIKK